MAVYTLSICTGACGLELGLEIAGLDIRPVCYVEREAYAAANLVRLMEAEAIPSAPIWSDVRSICDAQFRAFMEGGDGKRIDLIVGGYPCQPFSVAGKRLGEADDRHLWPAIAEAVGLYEPSLCFFENVPGHLN